MISSCSQDCGVNRPQCNKRRQACRQPIRTAVCTLAGNRGKEGDPEVRLKTKGQDQVSLGGYKDQVNGHADAISLQRTKAAENIHSFPPLFCLPDSDCRTVCKYQRRTDMGLGTVAWWHLPSLSPRRLRQENQEFEGSLNYRARSCLKRKSKTKTKLKEIWLAEPKIFNRSVLNSIIAQLCFSGQQHENLHSIFPIKMLLSSNNLPVQSSCILKA